jgi:hypothetical protein
MTSQRGTRRTKRVSNALNYAQFIDRADRIINRTLENGGIHADPFTLAEIVQQGYPVENLACLFDSRDLFVLYAAIEACYEIGKLAKPLVDRVAETMNNYDIKLGEGLVWLADFAEEHNTLADWMFLSFVDDEEESETAMRVLSGISFGQLRGAKKYLLENIPSSHHIIAIDDYINYYNDEATIYEMLDNSNTTRRRYAVALASRYFVKNLLLRDKAMKIRDDDTIVSFVQEKIRRIEFEFNLYQWYPAKFLALINKNKK